MFEEFARQLKICGKYIPLGRRAVEQMVIKKFDVKFLPTIITKSYPSCLNYENR